MAFGKADGYGSGGFGKLSHQVPPVPELSEGSGH